MADNEDVVIRLKDYPPMFNETSLTFFPEIKVNSEKIASENRSESGYDIVQVIRRDKWNVPVKLKLADDYWVKFFYELSLLDSVTYKQYSPLVQGYTTRTVRIDNFEFAWVKGSDKLEGVNGVWEVSFTLKEF